MSASSRPSKPANERRPGDVQIGEQVSKVLIFPPSAAAAAAARPQRPAWPPGHRDGAAPPPHPAAPPRRILDCRGRASTSAAAPVASPEPASRPAARASPDRRAAPWPRRTARRGAGSTCGQNRSAAARRGRAAHHRSVEPLQMQGRARRQPRRCLPIMPQRIVSAAGGRADISHRGGRAGDRRPTPASA